MKLLLTSEGITNTSIANVLENLLAKPFKECKVVHIPTAANGEPGDDKSWIQTQVDGFRRLGFSTIDVVDISQISRNMWLPLMEQAHVISFGGGNTKYLLEQIRVSGVAEVLPQLLETRVYVGMSAGSMITADTLSLTDEGQLYYDTVEHVGRIEGLGYIPFEIRPHLNDAFFTNIRLGHLEKLSKENPIPFYAIDDNSAVVVDGETISVISEGEWKKFN